MALTQVQGGMLAGSTNTTTTIQSNGTTAITINSSQQVGIGRVPGTGRTLELATATDYTNIVLQNTSTGSGSTDGTLLEAAGSDTLLVNYETGNMRFFTSATERMRIDSSGNLLVGKTTTATNTVGCVIGSLPNFIANNSSGDGPYIQIGNIASSVVNGYRYISFRVNSGGTEVGYISTNGSSSTSYVTSSDYRLKENITPMIGALDKVALLKPCTYTWKVDGSNGQGFIAHELAEVVPDAVVGQKDAVDEEGNPKYQGVDTSFLVATLTAAIQELNAKVEAQAAEIAALKAAP